MLPKTGEHGPAEGQSQQRYQLAKPFGVAEMPTEGRKAISDSAQIRQSALQTKVTYTTTLAGGEAFCRAIKVGPERTVRRLQDLHAGK